MTSPAPAIPVPYNPDATTLESIDSFVALFKFHCAMARVSPVNVLGRMNLQTKISASADKVQSQCWIDFMEVGQDSYYARLAALRTILENYFDTLTQTQGWSAEQVAEGRKFFAFFDELRGKFQSEVNHVVNYVRDSYVAAETMADTYVPVGDDGSSHDITVIKDPTSVM